MSPTSAEIRTGIIKRLNDGSDCRFGESYFPLESAHALDARLIDVYEALWAMLGEGVIYLNPDGQGSGMSNWRWTLSDIGRQIAKTGTWEPYDPDGYLRRLRDQSHLAAEALAYVEEALRAFNARCYLASSVMLGVAAEQAFGRLSAAFVHARPQETARLAKLLDDNTSQYVRFTEFRKRLDPIRPQLPDGLGDAITLDAVADLLRVTRNAAGHPTGQRVDAETAHTHLVMAATLLTKMTALAEHFEGLAPAQT